MNNANTDFLPIVITAAVSAVLLITVVAGFVVANPPHVESDSTPTVTRTGFMKGVVVYKLSVEE